LIFFFLIDFQKCTASQQMQRDANSDTKTKMSASSSDHSLSSTLPVPGGASTSSTPSIALPSRGPLLDPFEYSKLRAKEIQQAKENKSHVAFSVLPDSIVKLVYEDSKSEIYLRPAAKEAAKFLSGGKAYYWNEKWLIDRPWVRFDKNTESVYCICCALCPVKRGTHGGVSDSGISYGGSKGYSHGETLFASHASSAAHLASWGALQR
jgi:hypothetical protein